eukprot:TRINITY_DN1824_c5_g1_i1.p1 TRINITY_DN1824_c5_g1~~TRINITY_DN1824_c5_g1_i1.p1  ORF type:complete len:302 (+),score=54.61 TRINITY_DN1824_c5_g1_i1:43-906(+)
MTTGVKIMGVCNVTPDSFSGDGWLDTANEYQQTMASNVVRKELASLIEQGANLVDVGAESTAPGSEPITIEEEMRRLTVVMEAIRGILDSQPGVAEFSVDTVNARTAEYAVQHGFTIVNDVSGGRNDPEMFKFIASKPSIKFVLMYCKNASGRADLKDDQKDVFQKIMEFFEERVATALDSGVQKSQIILDPGMGAFISAKPQDSIEVLKRLPEFRTRFDLPILLGASRKGFLTSLIKKDFGAKNRLGSSLAVALYAAQQGVNYLRVHDVLHTAQFLEANTSLLNLK